MRFAIALGLLLNGLHHIGAQSPTQTLRGAILDADTRQPLPGATLRLLGTEYGAVADSLGRFRLEGVPVGRYQAEASYVGYERLLLPEILLEAGKEVVLRLELRPAAAQLAGVEVRAARSDSRLLHPLSVKTLTVEETRRFPATFFDPARLATAFAGVVNNNDQANGLVIRGNSPNGLAWRLEGVDVVNPNHTPNAGTFSDRVTQSGGGVNILSAQMLGASQFYTGAFPAAYGNALSGVLDMRLRQGNNERHEQTFQASLIGLDLAAEGPLSPQHGSSYLANYRYSTIGLLSNLGVELGDEEINFQDLSFHLACPGKKGGELTVFGLGGLSENLFRAERDSSAWAFAQDRADIIFRSRMGALGGTYARPLGSRTWWHTAVVASAVNSTRRGSQLDEEYQPQLRELDEQQQARIGLHSWLQHKLAKGSLRFGLLLSRQAYDFLALDNATDTLASGSGSGLLWQPYAQWDARLAPSLSLSAGLHLMYFDFSGDPALEPRLALEWRLAAEQQLSFAYGLHSQLQPPLLYFARRPDEAVRNPLGFTRAHHLGLGYRHVLQPSLTLEAEVFYQHLFDVPIAAAERNAFSALNLLEALPPGELANAGRGRNYGLELSLQQYFARGYFFLLNATLYDSKYQGSDGIWRDTRFNGNYISNLTAGKEWEKQKEGGRQVGWGINGRVSFIGGFRETPIDAEASALAGRTVFREEEAFSIQQKAFFRTDLRLYRRWNRAKANSILSLDIQNLTNAQNAAFRYFDAQQGQVVEKFQLGLIPILAYRIEF